MTDIKGTDTQPAAAQADSLITEMRNFADVADSCQITDGNAVAAIRSWADRLAASTPAAPGMVAYLDIGAGGYLDLGSSLPEEQLLKLPKGRHALGIIGTYGIDGYAAAPVAAAPVGMTRDDAEQAISRIMGEYGFSMPSRAYAELVDELMSTPAAPGIDLEQFRPAVCAMGLYAVEPADVDEAKRLLRLIDDSLNGGNCCTCEGSGMIGGLLPAGGGYETEPCPDCSPKGGSDAPAGVLDALRSAEGLAMCCIAVDGYSRREIEEMARATAPRFTAAIKNMQATSAEVGA